MAGVSDAVPQHRQRRTRVDWVMVAAQMRPPPEVHIHRKGYLVRGPALVLQRHSGKGLSDGTAQTASPAANRRGSSETGVSGDGGRPATLSNAVHQPKVRRSDARLRPNSQHDPIVQSECRALDSPLVARG